VRAPNSAERKGVGGWLLAEVPLCPLCVVRSTLALFALSCALFLALYFLYLYSLLNFKIKIENKHTWKSEETYTMIKIALQCDAS
jgi:hypothetical protein